MRQIRMETWVTYRGLWSTYRGPGSCQRPCNPSSEPPSLHSTLSSPPPHHDKPDLHSITEPQATSPLPRPFFFFPSSPHPICHLHRLCPGYTHRDNRHCQAQPRGSETWQRVASVSPWWPKLEKPFNGFRLANS